MISLLEKFKELINLKKAISEQEKQMIRKEVHSFHKSDANLPSNSKSDESKKMLTRKLRKLTQKNVPKSDSVVVNQPGIANRPMTDSLPARSSDPLWTQGEEN